MYLSDDGTGVGFFKSVDEKTANLTAGALCAAKMTLRDAMLAVPSATAGVVSLCI